MGDGGAGAGTKTPICWPANPLVGALNDTGSSIKTKKQNQQKFMFSSGFLNLTCKKTFIFIEEPASFSAVPGGLAG